VAPSPDAIDALVDHLGVEQPAAFADGRSLSIDAVVEYARRSRGSRGRPSAGWGSLTPAEQHVAVLVADGLANRGIAQRLFVSPATVKTHLTHIYAKLGISNRTELAIHVASRAPESDGGGHRRSRS
jgi:DNA-binding NarL/FixJ family response regulator